jgi:putative two-component system response regulator
MTGQTTLDPDVRAQAHILIVDDHLANVELLATLLAKAGYKHLRGTTEARAVPAVYAEFDPDLILLDLHMPDIDGFEVMEQLAGIIPRDSYLPILVLTADINDDVRRRALAAGAHDFVSKPFDVGEVQLRIANLLRTRFLHKELARHNDILEDRVHQRTVQLEAARLEVLRCLSVAAEYRDDNTGEHIRRVGDIAAAVARSLDWPLDRVELIGQAAPLHDVGKLGISDVILRKPGKLTPDEFAHIKTHTLIGPQILADTHIPVLRLASEIARTHHEKWDGTGYPDGRQGLDIPVSGRIVAVADVFDALTHDRPYKSAWPVELAVHEIITQRGRHFDPEVVDAFLRTLHDPALANHVVQAGHERTTGAGSEGGGRSPSRFGT